MVTVAAVPRLGHSPRLDQLKLSESARERRPPVILHPMINRSDRSKLRVTGSAPVLDMRRSPSERGIHRMNVATCFSWVNMADIFEDPKKKRKYRKRAMASNTSTDEEVLELVTERLVNGYPGIHKMFQVNDIDGTESVTKHDLLKIMYNYVGYISHAQFDRLLQNLHLDHKDKISFDLFVSRFKEFEGIQKQWVPPIKKEAEAKNLAKAHPEEHLRDLKVPNEWSQLKVAPHAGHILYNSLRDKRVDLRSLLPDECYEPGASVSKVQMRMALQQLGVNLTDIEYKAFWEKYDTRDEGFVPMDKLYVLLGLDPEMGEPVKMSPEPQRPVMLHPNQGVPPRPAHVTAREFATGHHKIRTVDKGEQMRVEGEAYTPVRTPPDRSKVHADPTIEDTDVEAPEQTPAADAEARKKIANVKNQKPPRIQGNFQCVIDCLCHKFEEKANNLTMAFKLFDIYENSSVMRIDFRRVLSEFGFPLSALQLPSFVNMIGQSITHGLISYKQMLTKLCNRTDAFVAQILDDKINMLMGVIPGTAPATDNEEEAAGRGLVEYIHGDFIRIATNFLRLDNRNRGVVSQKDLKEQIERTLDFSLTDKQWADLLGKIPLDTEGNARYIDFMLSFKGGALGVWNMVKAGTVTVPRNKVVHEPSEEVLRLEKAKTEQGPTLKKKPDAEHRHVDQIRAELKEFFKNNLPEFDRRFKELDRKSHKRFSRWQFGAILKLCGFPINEKELDDVWVSLKLADDNMSTFVNVVTQFAPNFTSFQQHMTKAKQKEAEEGDQVHASLGEEGDEVAMGRQMHEEEKEKEMGADAQTPPLTSNQYLGNILIKVKPAVRKYWKAMKQEFTIYDPHGFGSVSYAQMQRMLDKLRCGLSVEERNQLCSQFDFKNIGRCNYLAFMKAFSEAPNTMQFVYSPHTHKLEKKRRQRIPLKAAKKLISYYQNLRRAFQKHDKTRCGELRISDFKRILKECDVPVSEEDLFHIFTEFDSNMNGRINYPEFLNNLTHL